MTGKERARQLYEKAGHNSKTCFLNMEAIDALPEEFDVIPAEVEFDPMDLSKSFTNVGTKASPSYYPKTELIYDIAEARGILGYGEKLVETIKDEVDINPMLCKPIEDEPTIRIMPVGVRVTKTSKVLCEDGTYRPSSPCTNEFNYWDRAVLDWLNDEKYNNGKYKTPLLRKLRYMELKKFAVSQAETKAFTKTVRELAGLPTGFKPDDLKTGCLILFRIVRSRAIIKLETAARIDAIRNGNTAQIEKTLNQTYEQPQIDVPTAEQGAEALREVFADPEPKPEPDFEPEFEKAPKEVNPDQLKDFTDMTYQEKKEHLKSIKYTEWDDRNKRMYIKNIIATYVDKDGENFETLNKISNCISQAKYYCINWADAPLDKMLEFVGKLERQKEVKKLDNTLP